MYGPIDARSRVILAPSKPPGKPFTILHGALRY
jgi:hypothetical protein